MKRRESNGLRAGNASVSGSKCKQKMRSQSWASEGNEEETCHGDKGVSLGVWATTIQGDDD